MQLNTENHGPGDDQLAQVNTQLKEKSAVQTSSQATTKAAAQSKSTAEVDNKSQAQWGFLKNIVNIDRFFSSGAEDTKKSSLTQ